MIDRSCSVLVEGADGEEFKCGEPSICYVYFSAAEDGESFYACYGHRDWAIVDVAATPHGRGHIYYIPVGEPATEIERKRAERAQRERERRRTYKTRSNDEGA